MSTKSSELSITSESAAPAEIVPAGISLTFVLAFFASMALSAQRLKAIAEVRASTMHRMTFNKSQTSGWLSGWIAPNVYPIAANGSANTVWLNLTKER